MQRPQATVHKQRWVLVLATAASFRVSLDALVVTTALPTIRHELGVSLTSLGACAALALPGAMAGTTPRAPRWAAVMQVTVADRSS
jgi:hypothetical protein